MVSSYAPPSESPPADGSWGPVPETVHVGGSAYESFPDIGEGDRAPMLLDVLGARCLGASSRFASLFPCAAVDLSDAVDDLAEGVCRQDAWRAEDAGKEGGRTGRAGENWSVASTEEASEPSGEHAGSAASGCGGGVVVGYGFRPEEGGDVPAGLAAAAAGGDVGSEVTVADENSLVWEGVSSRGSPVRDGAEAARVRQRGRTTIVAVPPSMVESDSESGVVDTPPPLVDGPSPLGSSEASQELVDVPPTPSPTSSPMKKRKIRFGKRLFGRKKKV